MKTRTVLMISLVLNAGLLGALAYLAKQAPQAIAGAFPVKATGPDRVIVAPAQQVTGSRFGPVYEAVLPGLGKSGRPELFDLEKGRRLIEPDFASFNNDSQAALNWLLTTGLDVCGVSAPDMIPCAVTYYMAIVPCTGDAWNKASAGDVLSSTELEGIKDPKRNSLPPNETGQCYMFRTHDGSRGLLQVEAWNNAVLIRYKFALEGESQGKTQTAGS